MDVTVDHARMEQLALITQMASSVIALQGILGRTVINVSQFWNIGECALQTSMLSRRRTVLGLYSQNP